MRWYRRSVLLSAFDGKPLLDPFVEGGGPFTEYHYWHFIAPHRPWREAREYWRQAADKYRVFNEMRNVYLRHVDEMPHHFQLHMMHAAQIVGQYHPDGVIREWWDEFYRMIVNDAHLMPEPAEMLANRLSDDELSWKEREKTPAR